ncbi:MAG TPA: TraB/GumN family protein [Candidatus Polarisedimenticolia bacterium]|nr:TraB/GumN family protein [Candidatus Polarisedimenticolia bacterium]
MLKRRHINSILIVLLAFLGAAQAQQAAPAQPKPRRFLMWRATSPTATVYLVGSIHLGDSSMYPLPKEVESAFAAAKVLAVEINIKNADQAKMMGLLQKAGFYTGDDSLTKHLSKETQAALEDYCTRHNVPRMGMEQLKPWVVAITIAAMAWQQAGEDPSLGIDLHFLNETKPPQRIDELETMESQLAIFAEASEEEQQSMLASILKKGDKIKDMIKRTQAAYMAGDPDALQKVMDEQDDVGSKNLEKKLLDDRNVVMTGKMEEYLKGKDPIFVVVGAAHIIGDKGIAKQLRDKGYKVDQVTLEAK